MFDETLLDSSPSRAPVLNGTHWGISFAVGVAGFLVGYFVLPLLNGPPESVSAGVIQSAFLAAIFFSYAAILCYTYSDTRHLGLNTIVWVGAVLILNIVGFVIYLIYSAAKTDNWKRATIPLAYIAEFMLIGVAILIPLLITQALPKTMLSVALVAPPPPPPPPPPPAPAAPVKVIKRLSAEDLMKAPTVIPKTIAKVKDEPEPPPQTGTVGVVGGVPGGMPGGSVGGVLGGIITGAAPPPPPPPPKAATPKRIRLGGQVEQAKLIFHPNPEYPPLAKMARIQGTVRLEAVISKDGTIQDLKAVSGHPLLVKAAIDAVGRWRYQPTLLNGEPVEVVTEVDVNFTLSE
ncbi:MAG TPA: energy transducer TonB [Terriglobia bacterium]|nr:energy transducer TonB [Terriglobia bacterium]